MKICLAFLLIMATILFSLGVANAGAQYNRYNQDIHILAAEQWKDPSKIIRFSDDAGPLARAVLNYDRVVVVLDEISKDADEQTTLAAFAKNIGPTISKYEVAFNKYGRQYESEYLVAVKIYYTILNKRNTVDMTSKPNDPNVAKLNKINAQINIWFINTIIATLSKQIKEGMFSKDGVVSADQIIATIKKDQTMEEPQLSE